MASHSKLNERRMRRHQLAFVSPAAWRSLLQTRDDLATDHLVADWVDKGWPLIGRRATAGEPHGVALGLPLPPFAGRRRLSLLMQPEDVLSTAQPPALSTARGVAPRAWWPTIDALDEVAARHALKARMFGSLAWCVLTGLDYLTDRGDLDLLLYVHRDTDLHRLAAEIARVEAAAPMRVDGELVRDDGVAVNWREFGAGAREILVKTVGGVTLLDRDGFRLGKMPA